MNSSTYIFGELSDGYTQYPEDSSSNLFKSIQSQCVAPSQLVIHRDENLMYYVYIRKIDKKRFIGFAVVINGYCLPRIHRLFSIFEKEVEDLVEKGVIINFTNDGEISSDLTSLAKEEEEAMSVVGDLHAKVYAIKEAKRLPPVDYSVSIYSRKIFKVSDPVPEIVNASCRFGFTIVLKDTDFDTVRLTSFKSILKNLNAEKNALIIQNNKLEESNRNIRRQKKQFKKVVVLFLAVIACGFGLYLMNVNLNNTQYRLERANSTIYENESLITNLRDSVSVLGNDLHRAARIKQRVENSLQRICSYSPFAVTRCEVSAGEVEFDYYSLGEKEITLTLKAVNERNSEIISNTHTLTLSKGNGSATLSFARTLDISYFYYVVIIYEGHIVGGKRW